MPSSLLHRAAGLAIRPRLRHPAIGLLLLLAAGLPAWDSAAADLRFLRVVPGEAAGEWVATIDAKPSQKEKLALTVDGAPVAAEWIADDPLTARLSAVPAAARWLEIGRAGKKRSVASAVRLASVTAADHAFSGWTVYHIMMGYFANGSVANDGEIRGWRHPNYAGGDLAGVLGKADYLKDLGVDAVWLSPLFASRTSHGYDVINYFRIADAVGVPGDPDASLALFRRLVAELHRRGIRVILDLPLNHASRSYERPEGDPMERGPRTTAARQDAEKLWDSWGAGFGYWDFDHEPTRRFLKEVALHWLVDENVDGLRLDYVRGVPHDFWAELYAEVKQAKPEAFLLGECWIDDQGPDVNAAEIATYYEGVPGVGPQLDSLVDFPLQMILTDVFARGRPAEQLEVWLQKTSGLYGGDFPTVFLDNHDLARFSSWNDNPAHLAAAVGLLASLSSPVVLFYGTETGLTHPGPKPGFTDAGRVPMPWEALDAGRAQRVREALQARRHHPAMTHGARLPLAAGKEHLVMAKVAPEETLLVGVNLASEPIPVELDLGGLPATAFEAVLGASLPQTGGSGEPGDVGKLTWTLPPLATVIVASRP